MKKRLLVVVAVLCLTTYAADKPVQAAQASIDYPIGSVVKNLYIHGWENNLVLQNPEDFSNKMFSYTFKVEALTPENINFVKFHGKDAIRLNRVESGQRGGSGQAPSTYQRESAIFLQPKTYRYMGANVSGDEASKVFEDDVVTKIFDIPKTAKIGESGSSNEGFAAVFVNGEAVKKIGVFKEDWILKGEDSSNSENLARFCTEISMRLESGGNIQMEECYIIDPEGHVIRRDDTTVVDLPQFKRPQRLKTPSP